MKDFKYILSILFAFLGFFSEKLKAEVIILESEKIESFSEQGFKETSAETEWLGLHYLEEETDKEEFLFFLHLTEASLSK